MVRKKRRSRKKKNSGAPGWLLFALLVSLLAAGGFAWLLLTPDTPPKETFVDIAVGSGSEGIAAKLEEAGVIRSRYAFDLVRLWKRGTLKAGEYRFANRASVTDVYARIARGDIYTRAITVPEGANVFDIANRLEQLGMARREDFITAAVKQTSLIDDMDPKATSLEGYLFPDTYRFPRSATAGQIAAAMVRRFRAVARELGLLPRRATGREGLQLNEKNGRASVHDTVTLASLIERETAVDAERPLVASVLVNRLEKRMPLMTDPAVIYGLERENRWRGEIYESDLKRETPYNTYRRAGLPPGPIANPGIKSLRAAMNPAKTSYLYFVAAGADPKGSSRFAVTLDEHNRNVADYRQAVKRAGGR